MDLQKRMEIGKRQMFQSEQTKKMSHIQNPTVKKQPEWDLID